MSEEIPVLETRVAHFGYGDTRFCGYGVRADLVGESGYWSSISLALGGPRLTTAQEEIFDGLAVASLNADPRIWPLKDPRLLSSFGSVIVGMAGSLIAVEGGFVAAPAIEGAAHLLVELRAHVDAGGELEAEVLARIAGGQRLKGFGVPNRDRDERVLGAMGLVEHHGLALQPHWKLMESVEKIALSQKGNLKLNIGAAMSAIFLDMGFSAPQIGILATLILLNNMVANAHEGAEQTSKLLQQLPQAFIRYEGAAPRLSPRAMELAEARTESS